MLEVPTNTIDGPWDDKEDYLRTHYELLREDAVASLRDGVQEFRERPWMSENSTVSIYEKVSFDCH